MRLLATISLAIAIAALVVAPVAATAETPLEQLPGYIPIDSLGLFAHQVVSVEVNLNGPLLELVGAATQHDDPDFAKTISALRGIQVRVIDLPAAKASPVRAQLADTAHWLEAQGRAAIVKVAKADEDDSIYTLTEKQQIVGLAVLHYEAGKEAALVNIIGHLDPAELGRLGHHIDLPGLDHLPVQKRPPQP